MVPVHNVQCTSTRTCGKTQAGGEDGLKVGDEPQHNMLQVKRIQYTHARTHLRQTPTRLGGWAQSG